MNLSDVIPDADMLLALEPEELGIRMLPVLARWPDMHHLDLAQAMDLFAGQKNNQFALANYPLQKRPEIREAIAEAWAWLEGQGLLIYDDRYVSGVRKLGRRARQIAQQPDIRRALAARKIPKDTLHSHIRESVWALYHRGEYELAIIAAMKAVEVRVRAVAGFTNADYGKDMIARAFNPKSGPLRDDSAEPAERDALLGLMTGAFGLYRNSYAHRNMEQEDPDEAAEIIMLANHLLRIVDARQAAKVEAP